MDAERRKTLEATTRWDPGAVEKRVFERWIEGGWFHPPAEGSPDENYSIAIPPPNVTGALHMGHALNGAIQDVLIRLNRMRGRNTFWILGTDHAGIATQAVVEKELAEQGKSRKDLGREEFLKRVWEWQARYGSTIIEQFKRLGASCDYERERFTLDEGYVRAVYRVFVELYEKGAIYRDNYMVNWDPGAHSAISDLEVENREVTDTLYEIAYPLEDGGELIVATVRPETMLADTAVAVNPKDERYSEVVGKHAILPLVGRRLPVIADEHVDPEFGTGALKITPGHAPNDFEIGREHGLEEISVIGEDGRMIEPAPERFIGMTAADAQEAVVAELREQGLIRGEKPYQHSVPFSHRSGERIEPLISLQWFCRMDELAKPAIEAVEQGRVSFIPDAPHRRVYLDWMERIRPWCISRQLWWGHRLPVWYRGAPDEEPDIYVGEEPPEGEGWEQDEDVLDTWFSSALWPFATLGWPDTDAPEFRAFFPTDVLSTARDIIFLWVARMVMTSLEFTGEVPFSDVYVHSVIQAPDGRRMSKSLGTGIDPLDEIKVHGADALRFGLLGMSSAQDVRYSEARVKQGRDLANKMWNASRLILLNAREDVDSGPRSERVEDRWIASRLQRADRLGDREHRGLRLRPRRSRSVRVLLVGALRLVPGDRQAPPLRRRRGCLGEPPLGPGAGARPRPPADAVRERGDLLVPAPARGRGAGDSSVPGVRRVSPRRSRRGGDRRRDQAHPGPAALARPRRVAGRPGALGAGRTGPSPTSWSIAWLGSSSAPTVARRSRRWRGSSFWRPRALTRRRSRRGSRSAARSCAPR